MPDAESECPNPLMLPNDAMPPSFKEVVRRDKLGLANSPAAEDEELPVPPAEKDPVCLRGVTVTAAVVAERAL